MCNEGNMNKRKVHINPEYIEFRQECLDSCESELFNFEILLESRQCFFSESDFKNHRTLVCMLIAEKDIIENEYRRIDIEIYDLFPRQFGDVSFR